MNTKLKISTIIFSFALFSSALLSPQVKAENKEINKIDDTLVTVRSYSRPVSIADGGGGNKVYREKSMVLTWKILYKRNTLYHQEFINGKLYKENLIFKSAKPLYNGSIYVTYAGYLY